MYFFRNITGFYLILFISYMTTSITVVADTPEKSPTNNLVNILSINPRIKLDIRYATADNFLGFSVYEQAVCYLHKEVAEALHLVQLELETYGLGLKIFDGYRPLSVQQIMWDTVQDERYVSNPAKNKGRHTRATAVDLTLVDREGNMLEMPSDFDDFTERAHTDYADISATVRDNRQFLTSTMEKYGFIQFPFEWWHFDYKGWQNDEKYPPLDISFQEIEDNFSFL